MLQLLEMPGANPPVVSAEARARRLMYQTDRQRTRDEESFAGPREDFLATLGLTFRIWPAREGDLPRAEELTARTSQFNATGRAYSSADLDAYRRSSSHKLLLASLDDKYGSYGTIGLALVEIAPDLWTIKSLLTSCRVVSRGAGGLFIAQLRQAATEAGVRLRAEVVENGRNRLLYVTYRFAGFRDVEREGSRVLLEAASGVTPPTPKHIAVQVETT
jgi:FkbH-like protein